MAAKTATHTWDQYVREAEVPPFVLKVSAEETLEFHNPTGVALIRIMRGMREGDLEVILASLSGNQWERVQQLLGGAGHGALPSLVEDLMDHFNLYDDVELQGPSGGKVTKRRPRDIQALLNQGYRPVGEAHAS